MSDKLLFNDSTWTMERLEKTWAVIQKLAEKYNLDYYPAQIEIVTADQMLSRHSSGALPTMYKHWSFGKNFIESKKKYDAGKSSLAYETVINTNPSLCYILDNNSMTMQALVLAHAAIGHSSFFKNNYLFKENTYADYILDYLSFAKKYIRDCEEKYGEKEVERLLDACHALQLYGVDKTKRRRRKTDAKKAKALRELLRQQEKSYNHLWDKTIPKNSKSYKIFNDFAWPFPEENILYFIEKNSPALDEWQREVVRIVRKIAQYFYPQYQTKVMNEGWASFWHYTLMTDLADEGYISEGSYIEFLESHTGVCCQPETIYRSMYGLSLPSFNPYALGFNIFMDIKRMAENATDEDRKYCPDACDRDWLGAVTEAMEQYRDDSFIAQYLSPKVIRDMKMFVLSDSDSEDVMAVPHIQDGDYKEIRRTLSNMYNINTAVPIIEVTNYKYKGDRSLVLTYRQNNNVELQLDYTKATLKHLKYLWGHPVALMKDSKEGSTTLTKRVY